MFLKELIEKCCTFLVHIINTRMCSRQAAGMEWLFLAWGIKFWAGEWRRTLTGRGRRLGERCQIHISAAGTKYKTMRRQEVNMSMKVPCRFSDWENDVTVSHLEEQEDRWRGAEGSVIQSDDGGATGAKQVSHLWKKKITYRTQKCCSFVCKIFVFLQNSEQRFMAICTNFYVLMSKTNSLSDFPELRLCHFFFFYLKMLKLSTVSSLSQTDVGLFLCTCMLVMRNMTPPTAIMGRAG